MSIAFIADPSLESTPSQRVSRGPNACEPVAGADARAHAGQGFFSRLRASFIRSRMREAELRVGAYIEAHGGRLTDQMERHILDDITGAKRGGLSF